jgi:hypothetical protein
MVASSPAQADGRCGNHGEGMAARDDRRVDGGGAPQPGRTAVLARLSRCLHSGAERAGREYSVPQWARWSAASLAVVIAWMTDIMPGSPGSYVYLVLFIALMLYPDAQAISVAGLRIESLKDEVVRQDKEIAALNHHVQLLTSVNSTLVASTRQVVSVAVGDVTLDSQTAGHSQLDSSTARSRAANR